MNVQFHFDGGEADQSVPVFSIDDGGQPPVTLSSKHRDIMAATFTKFLLMNIGKIIRHLLVIIWTEVLRIRDMVHGFPHKLIIW